MAENGIINYGSKYLICVREDNFGTEKWLRFENPDGSTPPTGANHFTDYIVIGAAGDSMAANSTEKSFYEDDFTGVRYENSAIESADPKVNMIGSFDDLKFILKTFMDDLAVPIVPPGGTSAISTTLLSGNLRPDVRSLTLYGGVFDDKETMVTGCQIDELDVAFTKEDGVIPISLTLFGSKFKLGELKPQGVINNLRDNPALEGWNIDSIYIDLSLDEDNKWVENSDEWEQIGCEVTEANFNIKNNLDTDSGAGICSAFSSVSSMSDFKSLNRFRGKLTHSDNTQVTLELTKKQTTAFWKQLQMGGVTVVEEMTDQPYKMKIVFYNVEGSVLVLGFPGCSATSDSPSLSSDAEEKITLDQTRPGSFVLNEGGSELSSGNIFAHFYPSNFYSTQGIGFAQLLTGPNSNNAYAKSRIIVQRASDDHIVSLYDLTKEDFNNQGGIIKTKFKLYKGDYNIYIRTKANPAVKDIIGSFTITGNHSIETPFCLNSLPDVYGKFAYNNCVATAVDEEMSPNPIDVEPEEELKIEDKKEDITVEYANEE